MQDIFKGKKKKKLYSKAVTAEIQITNKNQFFLLHTFLRLVCCHRNEILLFGEDFSKCYFFILSFFIVVFVSQYIACQIAVYDDITCNSNNNDVLVLVVVVVHTIFMLSYIYYYIIQLLFSSLSWVVNSHKHPNSMHTILFGYLVIFSGNQFTLITSSLHIGEVTYATRHSLTSYHYSILSPITFTNS